MQDFRRLVELIRTWDIQKKAVFKDNPFNGGTNAASLKEFTEIQNRMTRLMIGEFGEERDPSFYQSLAELCMNAERFIAGGKLFVNKEDVTQRGM